MTLPTPSTSTVSNTSCLIALETIAHLDLLPSLYNEVLVPPAVVAEWGTVVPAWLKQQTFANQALAQALSLQLGKGEAEAIALAIELQAARLILDDQQARNIANSFKLNVTGTIGVILRAKQGGFVPLVRPLFDDLRSKGFWVSDALYHQALLLAGE